MSAVDAPHQQNAPAESFGRDLAMRGRHGACRTEVADAP